jgi:type IV secretion system protein VirD4
LLPVIQSRSQLRGVYGEHVADEIVANCGVEIAFTPKELRVANELSERIGYLGQDSVTRSRAINGLLGNRSKSTSEHRRALLLPQELIQFPTGKMILLRGGIPPIVGDKIIYFKSRFFRGRGRAAPVVPPIARQKIGLPDIIQRPVRTKRKGKAKPVAAVPPGDDWTNTQPSTFLDPRALLDGHTVNGTLAEGDQYA